MSNLPITLTLAFGVFLSACNSKEIKSTSQNSNPEASHELFGSSRSPSSDRTLRIDQALRSYVSSLPQKASMVTSGPQGEVAIFGMINGEVAIKVCTPLSIVNQPPGQALSCPMAPGTSEVRYPLDTFKKFVENQLRFGLATFLQGDPDNLRMFREKISGKPRFMFLSDQEFNWVSQEGVSIQDLGSKRVHQFDYPVATDETVRTALEFIEAKLNSPEVDRISFTAMNNNTIDGAFTFQILRAASAWAQVNEIYSFGWQKKNPEKGIELAGESVSYKNKIWAQVTFGLISAKRVTTTYSFKQVGDQDPRFKNVGYVQIPLTLEMCQAIFLGMECNLFGGEWQIRPLLMSVWSEQYLGKEIPWQRVTQTPVGKVSRANGLIVTGALSYLFAKELNKNASTNRTRRYLPYNSIPSSSLPLQGKVDPEKIKFDVKVYFKEQSNLTENGVIPVFFQDIEGTFSDSYELMEALYSYIIKGQIKPEVKVEEEPVK